MRLCEVLDMYSISPLSEIDSVKEKKVELGDDANGCMWLVDTGLVRNLTLPPGRASVSAVS